MIISYMYPIYPTKELEQKLLAPLDTCRWPYNRLMDEMNKA
jgi:putative transposase